MVLMLSYSYFSSAQQLMSASHSALTAISAAGKVEEILDTDTSRPFDPLLPEDKEHFNGIRMENVSYGYKGRSKALQNLSLTVPKGFVIALVGLSGCGKSTTASLLMRFCDASAGHIYMEGKDYHSMKPDADDKALMEAVTEAGLLKFVQSLENGLDSDIGNAGASLSGGQRQKMGIARALLSKAEYMIFDEATSSVDPESEKEIWDTISRLAHTRTLIIISHRMSSVRSAHCIYVLKDGQVAQQGDHEALMAQDGLYRQLVLRQQIMEVTE